jgi:hypothetical protein
VTGTDGDDTSGVAVTEGLEDGGTSTGSANVAQSSPLVML